MNDKLSLLSHIKNSCVEMKKYVGNLLDGIIATFDEFDEKKADKTIATTEEDGLMSKSDKEKLDGMTTCNCVTDDEVDGVIIESFDNIGIFKDAVLYEETKARFTLTLPNKDDFVAAGIISKKEDTENYTMENARELLIKNGTKRESRPPTTNMNLNVTPDEKDSRIWAMGFVVVEKDGKEIIAYTEPKSAKVSELK